MAMWTAGVATGSPLLSGMSDDQIHAMRSIARRRFELVEPIGSSRAGPKSPARRGSHSAPRLLGRLLRRPGRAAGRRPRRGGGCALLRLRSGRGRPSHPDVWRTTTPEEAIAARQTGCVRALRRILRDHVEGPGFARASDLLPRAVVAPPVEDRPLYGGALHRPGCRVDRVASASGASGPPPEHS